MKRLVNNYVWCIIRVGTQLGLVDNYTQFVVYDSIGCVSKC